MKSLYKQNVSSQRRHQTSNNYRSGTFRNQILRNKYTQLAKILWNLLCILSHKELKSLSLSPHALDQTKRQSAQCSNSAHPSRTVRQLIEHRNTRGDTQYCYGPTAHPPPLLTGLLVLHANWINHYVHRITLAVIISVVLVVNINHLSDVTSLYKHRCTGRQYWTGH